jgi:hypothetical protein
MQEQMKACADINAGIAFTVFLFGIVLFLIAWLFKWPTFLRFERQQASTTSFVLWIMWWFSMFVAYTFISNKDPIPYGRMLLILDWGDLCLVGSVLAYAAGNETIRDKAPCMRRLVFLIIIGLGYFAYYSFHVWRFANNQTLLSDILFISPSLVLANVAIVAFGWIFVARWGLVAIPLLLLTVVYSALQLPAYTFVFLFKPHFLDPGILSIPEETINVLRFMGMEDTVNNLGNVNIMLQKFINVFYALSFLKIILIAYPLFLWMSTTESDPKMEEEMFWPDITYFPPVNMKILGAITAAVGFILGIFGREIVSHTFKALWAYLSKGGG